jgi:hypothetical protein
MPYLVFFEWLAPVILSFGLLFSLFGAIAGFLDISAQWWLLALVMILANLGSIIAILLDEISFTAYKMSDVWKLFVAAFLENFGYRQIVTYANLLGFLNWLFHRPIRGSKKYPGIFVRAWKPKAEG